MKTPKYELMETDHGIDGWDAKTRLIARFTEKQKAEAWLAAKGHTYIQYGSYYHQDENRRHTMGAISYNITDALCVPEDPEPGRDLHAEAIGAEAQRTALAKLNPTERKALGLT